MSVLELELVSVLDVELVSVLEVDAPADACSTGARAAKFEGSGVWMFAAG